MSISVNSITPSYLPPSDAYISEAATNIQADLAKTESMVEAIRSAQTGEDPKAVMEACQAFESYFLQLMFKEMRKTVIEQPQGGLFAKSNGERIFQDMMDEQVSIMAANNGGIGLAAFMYKQMQREEHANLAELGAYKQMRQEGQVRAVDVAIDSE